MSCLYVAETAINTSDLVSLNHTKKRKDEANRRIAAIALNIFPGGSTVPEWRVRQIESIVSTATLSTAAFWFMLNTNGIH